MRTTQKHDIVGLEKVKNDYGLYDHSGPYAEGGEFDTPLIFRGTLAEIAEYRRLRGWQRLYRNGERVGFGNFPEPDPSIEETMPTFTITQEELDKWEREMDRHSLDNGEYWENHESYAELAEQLLEQASPEDYGREQS